MTDDTQSPTDVNAESTPNDADRTGTALPITRRYYLALAAAVGAMKSTNTVGAASVAGISPYYNLAPDPTSESLIYWIDERDGADGGEQTFEFGTSPDSLTQQETATSDAVPEKDGIYRYSADLSGLDEGTTYYGEIVDDGTTLASFEWNTLPDTLPEDGLDIAVYSDIHIDNSDGMNDPSDMEVIRDENPDLILFGGDYITWGDGATNNRSDEEVVDWWLDLFRDWYGTLNQDRLHPVLPIPGNHEVGNHSWDGTGSVNPEQGVFQFFYGYPRYLDPVGENYGEVTVGDYLQLLALDTHSAYPEDVAGWLEGAINENVLCTIPYHHSPLLTGGNRRQPEDDELQELLRDEWLRLLWDDESVLCHFAGHIHLREYTVPYEVVAEEPTSGDYIALDDGADGYLVEDDDATDSMMQFGTGYRANRSYDDEWFIDYIAEENQFYSLTLTSSELEVRELDGSGNQYESHIFSTGRDGDTGEGTTVSVTTAEATDVGESSATLNGELTELTGTDSADVYFEWGESGAGLPNRTDGQTLDSTGAFDEPIDGLDQGTTYEFRAIAEAGEVSDTGDTVTFTTEESEPETNPVINRFELSDISNPTWARVEVDWAVSDEGGDLNEVTTVLNGGVDSEISNVSGSSASDTHELRERNGHGEAEVTLTVIDAQGNVTSATKTTELTSSPPGQGG